MHSMRRPGLAVSAVLLLFTIAVLLSAVPAARGQEETDDEGEFSYSPEAENGPAHWGEIKEEWLACGRGKMSSPIDISSSRVSLLLVQCHLGYLNHSYRPVQATIVNRGHDIMVRFDGDVGSVSIDGTVYYLQQLHWHSPTEHSVDGCRYDTELHMVHESVEKNVAVIGVFYEVGAPDAFLHKLEPYLKIIAEQKEREEKVGVTDPGAARGRASVYYRYMGSLTTPPCSQGVVYVWTIVKREMNARPLQEVNNRDVSIFLPYQQNKL